VKMSCEIEKREIEGNVGMTSEVMVGLYIKAKEMLEFF